MRRFGLWWFAAVVLYALPLAASAQQQLQGPVILTVAGDIKVTNRGPVEFLQDPILAHHDLQFEQAMAFDMAMLEGLEQVSAAIKLSKWPSAAEMSGPSLAAIMAAVEAVGGTGISVLGLDGFRADLSADDLAAHDWFLAIRKDGRPLDIGGMGPAWLVFQPGSASGEATREESSTWPWAAFYIEVTG